MRQASTSSSSVATASHSDAGVVEGDAPRTPRQTKVTNMTSPAAAAAAVTAADTQPHSSSSSSSVGAQGPFTAGNTAAPYAKTAETLDNNSSRAVHGDDGTADDDAPGSGSTARHHRSSIPTHSPLYSGGAASTMAAAASAPSVGFIAVPRSAVQSRPVLTAQQVGAQREPSPPPPPPARGPVMAATATARTRIGAYTSVPVLPPQVFRSASSTTAASATLAGGSSMGGAGAAAALTSADSTPVLSPPQQSWFSPATGGQMSSPMRGAAHSGSTGVTSPMSSVTGPISHAVAASASSPTHLTMRTAFSMGGSRKRNSVSVPTHPTLGSEDDDMVNLHVAEDAYPSAEQWLLLSQSPSNVGNTAVTSRSSSHDGTTQLSEESARVGNAAAAHPPPPTAWMLMRPQALIDPHGTIRGAPTTAAHPLPEAARSSAQSPPSETTHTPLLSRSANPSHDHSPGLSFRSPMQSPPVSSVVSGGRGGAGRSRHGSLGSLRPVTHDPYHSTVMSPVLVPRTGSLSSLRSPSTTLTSPTGAPSSGGPPASTAGMPFDPARSAQPGPTRPGPHPHHAHHHQLSSRALPRLVSPLSQSGHADAAAALFPHSPSPSFSPTSPTQYGVPPPPQVHQQPQHQPQQQQHQQQPRRRSAREALTGFFSEVAIELGDQTHLVTDRNGIPYQEPMPGTDPDAAGGGVGGPGIPYGGSSDTGGPTSQPPPPPLSLPSSAYPPPSGRGAVYPTEGMKGGGGGAQASYPYQAPTFDQQQRSHAFSSPQAAAHGAFTHDQRHSSYGGSYGAVPDNGDDSQNVSTVGFSQSSAAPRRISAVAGTSSVYYSHLDSHNMRGVAYSDGGGGASRGQLSAVESAMYNARSGGRGGGSGRSTYEQAHYPPPRSTSPGDRYSYVSSPALSGMYNEMDALLDARGTPSPSLPANEPQLPTYVPPQHRTGAIFSAPPPPSKGSAGGRPLSAAAMQPGEYYNMPASFLAPAHRPPPPPHPQQQQQQQHYQQQMMSKSCPGSGQAVWTEGGDSGPGMNAPPLQPHQQWDTPSPLNRVPDATLSPYAYAPTSPMDGPAPHWANAGSTSGESYERGNAQGQRMQTQRYNMEGGGYGTVNHPQFRGGSR